MTPKEKAAILVLKFLSLIGHKMGEAKQCALITVDEIINIGCIEVPYWLEVKQEINKL